MKKKAAVLGAVAFFGGLGDLSPLKPSLEGAEDRVKSRLVPLSAGGLDR